MTFGEFIGYYIGCRVLETVVPLLFQLLTK